MRSPARSYGRPSGWRRRAPCRSDSRAGSRRASATRRVRRSRAACRSSSGRGRWPGPAMAPVTCFQPRPVRNRWSPLATISVPSASVDPVGGLDRRPVRQHLGRHVVAVRPALLGADDPVADAQVGDRPLAARPPSGPGVPGQAVDARMAAAPIGIDRPGERHRRFARARGSARSSPGPRGRSARGTRAPGRCAAVPRIEGMPGSDASSTSSRCASHRMTHPNTCSTDCPVGVDDRAGLSVGNGRVPA